MTSSTLRRDAALVLCLAIDAFFLWRIIPAQLAGGDAISWWTVDLADPYGQAVGSMVGAGAFRYSPAVAQVFAPFALLPWQVFELVFLGVQLAAIGWMGGSRWPLIVLFPPVLYNLHQGNIDTLLGAAIVAGFRWPGAWAFLLLTKVTPGVGVLWFAFRREWRAFATALGVTAAIVVVSYLTVPTLWAAWVAALRTMSALPQSSLVPPLVVRLPVAVAVVWWAARSDARWLLPVACLIAVPNPWFVTWAILGAGIALWPSGAPSYWDRTREPDLRVDALDGHPVVGLHGLG